MSTRVEVGFRHAEFREVDTPFEIIMSGQLMTRRIICPSLYRRYGSNA